MRTSFLSGSAAVSLPLRLVQPSPPPVKYADFLPSCFGRVLLFSLSLSGWCCLPPPSSGGADSSPPPSGWWRCCFPLSFCVLPDEMKRKQAGPPKKGKKKSAAQKGKEDTPKGGGEAAPLYKKKKEETITSPTAGRRSSFWVAFWAVLLFLSSTFGVVPLSSFLLWRGDEFPPLGWCRSLLLLWSVLPSPSSWEGAPSSSHLDGSTSPPCSHEWRCCVPLSFWVALLSSLPAPPFGWHCFPPPPPPPCVYCYLKLWMCIIFGTEEAASTTSKTEEGRSSTSPKKQ